MQKKLTQINNGFADYYYISEDGIVYNNKLKCEVKQYENHRYRLNTENNEIKYITLQDLYRKVYDKEYCIDNTENLKGEIWCTIKHTNGKYKVSNKGRIKSLQKYTAKILKDRITKQGYKRIEVIDMYGNRKSWLVHRLVANAFMLPPDNELMQIHHKDKNRLNNNVENLIWLTPEKHNKIHNK